MKIKTTVFIHYSKHQWQKDPTFEVYPFAFEDNEYRAFVGEQEIEIDVPDDYDPRAQQIAALEAKKQKAMADYQKTVTDINAQISKLQAIEHSV